MSAILNPKTDGRERVLPFPASVRHLSTRLLSRAQFLDSADRGLERTKKCLIDRSVILCLDIDRFRVVTAGLGREVGDRALVAIAQRIDSLLTGNDSFARIGGDEFAILMEEPCRHGSAMELAEAIQQELKDGVQVGGSTIYATASVGIARLTANYTVAEDALRDAEIAMYNAKKLGRARAEIFHPAMLSNVVDQFELEIDLRHAVDRGEFVLFYQPIVSSSSGRVYAFEALLRWNHPTRGLLSPAVFLDLLKETGLITVVGKWVVHEACTQAKRWHIMRGKPIPVTINLAPQQFTHSSIISMVANAIEESGVDPSAVVLEITEDALLEDLDAARQILLPLRQRGVRIMIDDFGTGYSSLSYLRRLPVDAIKIDASFVDRIERFTEDRLIVRAIVALAHALDLCVIAEGVERRGQLIELLGLDCEEVQGFLISRPVTVDAATEMVSNRWAAVLS